MGVVDEYIASLEKPAKEIISHMYEVAQQVLPDATQEMSYAMPSLKYKSKSLIAIMANKNFLSLYPFGGVEKLGLDLSAYECTRGSIHFSKDKPIPDDLLRNIVTTRVRQIESV